MAKEQLKANSAKSEQITEELSDGDLKCLRGGFKLHEYKINPTQVPMSQGW